MGVTGRAGEVMKYNLFKRVALPPRKFVEWCRQAPTNIPQPMSLNQFMREHKNESDQKKLVALFVKQVNSSIQGGIASADFNQALDTGPIIIRGKKDSGEQGFFRLNITMGIRGEFIVEDVSIRELRVDNKSGNPIKIHLKQCHISKFILDNKPDNDAAPVEVRCDNTSIGCLEMHEDAVRSLIMEGGCVLDITCPAPGKKSPITGDVAFSNVFFPRNTKDYLLSGAQAYRSFRHHLMNLQNIQAANLIRSAELAVERETDQSMNKCLGLLYEWFSDHGSSTWRPLAWLLGFFLVSFSIIFCVNGAVQGLPDEAMYAGWRSALIEPGGNIWKALYLAFQPIINPLGIFSRP